MLLLLVLACAGNISEMYEAEKAADVNLINLEKVIVPVSIVREVDALGVLDQAKNLIAPELNI